MKTNITRCFLASTTISFLSPSIGQAQTSTDTFEILDRWYQSDEIALEAEELSITSEEGATKTELRFRGHDREWVTARLAVQDGVTKPPVVIALHGATQSRDQWFRLEGPYSFPAHHAAALLGRGVAVLALDARNHGDRIEADKDFENPYSYIENWYIEATSKMVSETASDVVRALEFLDTRSDLNRFDWLLSLGAMSGWIAAAVDDRIDRALLMAMPIIPQDPPLFSNPPLYYPGLVNRPLMLPAANQDTFYTIEQMTELFEGLPSDQKELVVIEGTHDLPHHTATYSIEFLANEL